jgi:hypothetical protein
MRLPMAAAVIVTITTTTITGLHRVTAAITTANRFC